MTYDEAMEFAGRKNLPAFSRLPSNCVYTLPSEALWEYACRAGTTTDYYFGNDGSGLKNHAWTGGKGPHEVALKPANPWGFYDLYGNIGEIVLDTWEERPSVGTDPLKSGTLGPDGSCEAEVGGEQIGEPSHGVAATLTGEMEMKACGSQLLR